MHLVNKVFVRHSNQVTRTKSERVVVQPPSHVQRAHVEKVSAEPPRHLTLDTLLKLCNGLNHNSFFAPCISTER
jgi:hypothetical protein